jgi:hypothetical protein
MRLCRYKQADQIRTAFYLDTRLLPIQEAARACNRSRNETIPLPEKGHLLAALPHGTHFQQIQQLFNWVMHQPDTIEQLAVPLDRVQLLTPIPR